MTTGYRLNLNCNMCNPKSNRTAVVMLRFMHDKFKFKSDYENLCLAFLS